MQPLPFTDVGAGVAFHVVLGAFVVQEVVVRVRSATNRGGTRADRMSLAVVALSLGVGVVAGVLLAGSGTGTIAVGRWPLLIAGVALITAGTALRLWAVVLLGRFFTVDVRVHADQVVVDHGPYRWVRHPSYSGLLLVCLGIGLALGDWAAVLVLVALPGAGVLLRIRVEEQALLEGLGAPYARFAAGRRRLVPGVW